MNLQWSSSPVAQIVLNQALWFQLPLDKDLPCLQTLCKKRRMNKIDSTELDTFVYTKQSFESKVLLQTFLVVGMQTRENTHLALLWQ